MPARSYTRLAIAIVVAAVVISASILAATDKSTTTSSDVIATTTTTRTVTVTGTPSQTACSEITVNGTEYCSLDVTENMTFEEPGYSLLNAPVTFMGVTFVSSCQSNVANCPTENQSASHSILYIGVISFELTFPDNNLQVVSAFYPSNGSPGQDEYYLETMQTSPRAGFLLESVSAAPYVRVILLVEAEQQVTPTAFTNSKNNLQLQLYLNASSSASRVAVSAVVDEYNPLASTNNVKAANTWQLPLNGGNGAPCWGSSWPVGFAIASGYYTSSNVIAAKFLDLVDPGAAYNCPGYLGMFGDATGYLFQPMSDTATGYGCTVNACPMEVVSTGLTPSSWGSISGYWNQGGSFISFPRGVYTVVAEDEWGNLALAYFTVS